MVAAPASPVTAEGSSLRVSAVSKSFPTPDEADARTHAIDAVALSVNAGELISFLGPSCCGNSTLLRLIPGLDFPDSGELWVGNNGSPARAPSAASSSRIPIFSVAHRAPQY